MSAHLSDAHLIQFLQDELSVSALEIAVVLRQRQTDHDPLPMLLWQYGLVTLDQLNQIFDWLESRTHSVFLVSIPTTVTLLS